MRMELLASELVAILTAETLDQATALALSVWVRAVLPRGACLLLWDAELGRYIVGQTWLDQVAQARPADFRRRVLRDADAARGAQPKAARKIGDDHFYQPLDDCAQHVGALVAEKPGTLPDPTDAQYVMLVRSAARAVYMHTRLNEAGREHAQLTSERERLAALLHAVEAQQRTIDRLLAQERRFSAALERKVEERTAALREAQHRLIQSEKLAVIGQLASSLAHELNNPLQALQSGLGLVMDDVSRGVTTDLAADLSVIASELERIQTLFRHMLDFYRPVTYEYAPLDLNGICEDAQVLLRRQLQDGRVTLHLHLAHKLRAVRGDRNQIKQVLVNLLLNAADAMPPSGGNIHLSTGSSADGVYVEIRDDGSGISHEHLARLFEPLFTTKTRGLGLGLAISQEIVERHGGRITAASDPGSGATFTVYLPAAEG